MIRQKSFNYKFNNDQNELNFFVNVCYLEAGAWEIVPGVGSFILKPKNVGKFIAEGAYNYTYAGDLYEDGGEFVVQRARIG